MAGKPRPSDDTGDVGDDRREFVAPHLALIREDSPPQAAVLGPARRSGLLRTAGSRSNALAAPPRRAMAVAFGTDAADIIAV